MVADFWGVETRGASLRACAAWTTLWRRVDSRQCTHESLKSTERGGSIVQVHGVMLKVELESYGRLHSVLMEGLRRKSTESRSLFQRESERHVVQKGYQWSDGDVILGIGR